MKSVRNLSEDPQKGDGTVEAHLSKAEVIVDLNMPNLSEFDLGRTVDNLSSADLVILPNAIEGGLGIYRSELAALAKHLAPTIEARYLYPAETRRWNELLGHTDLVLAIAIDVLASGMWHSLKLLFQSWAKGEGGIENLTLNVFQLGTNGLWIRSVRLHGPADAVVQALAEVPRLLENAKLPESNDEPET